MKRRAAHQLRYWLQEVINSPCYYLGISIILTRSSNLFYLHTRTRKSPTCTVSQLGVFIHCPGIYCQDRPTELKLKMSPYSSSHNFRLLDRTRIVLYRVESGCVKPPPILLIYSYTIPSRTNRASAWRCTNLCMPSYC